MKKSDTGSADYWSGIKKYGRRYENFDWPSVKLLLNFIHTYDRFSKAFAARRIRKVGLSGSSFNILMILNRSEAGGCNQQEISRLLLVSRANVTGLIDHLERRGLAARADDSRDRRIRIVRITREGRKLLEAYLPGYYKDINQLLSGFSKKEKELFDTFLERLHGAVG